MESGHASGTISGSKTPEEVNLGEKSLANDKSASPSTPSTSPSEESDANGTTSSTANSTGLSKANNGSETQCPPPQVMERTGEGDSLYRIPSNVFARNDASAQMEWSTASNESLFSIQMGNMSFTKDQLSWMAKSRDLDLESTFSGPLIDLSSSLQPAAGKSIDVGKKGGNWGEGIGETEAAAAAEKMRQVTKENEADTRKEKLPESDNKPMNLPQSGSTSRHSDGSVKSFAFPILAGDVDKSESVSYWHKTQKQKPHAPGSSKEPAQPNGNSGSEGPKKQASSKSQNPKAATDVDQGKWLSCLPCCPLC